MNKGLLGLLLLAAAGSCNKPPEPQPTPMPSPTPSLVSSICVMPSLDTAGYTPSKSIYYSAISDAESSVIVRYPQRFNGAGTVILGGLGDSPAAEDNREWFRVEIAKVLQTYGYCAATRDEWVVVASTPSGPFEEHEVVTTEGKVVKGVVTPFDCAYEDNHPTGTVTYQKCPGSYRGNLMLEPGVSP